MGLDFVSPATERVFVALSTFVMITAATRATATEQMRVQRQECRNRILVQ